MVDGKRDIIRLSGELPSPVNPPAGCHFHPRCPEAMPECRQAYPQEVRLSRTRTVSCLLYRGRRRRPAAADSGRWAPAACACAAVRRSAPGPRAAGAASSDLNSPAMRSFSLQGICASCSCAARTMSARSMKYSIMAPRTAAFFGFSSSAFSESKISWRWRVAQVEEAVVDQAPDVIGLDHGSRIDAWQCPGSGPRAASRNPAFARGW